MQNEAPDSFGDPNMNIEEKIRLFAELSGDERREVEQYVEARGDNEPHLKRLLEEAKGLDHLLASARRLGTSPPDREAIAFYAVMRGVDRGRLPGHLAEDLDRIGEEIAGSADLRTLLAQYEARASELASASDFHAHFEALTGHSRRGPSREPDVRRRDREPAPHAAAVSRGKDEDGARPDAGTRRLLQRAGVAVVVVATLYLALLALGRWVQPEYERLARFTSDELRLVGYENVRGEQPADREVLPDGGPGLSPTAAHVLALNQLRGAESSFLGLFPGFDKQRLDSAAVLLGHVIELEPDDSFLADEARYFLGKVELARGNFDEARANLARVASSPSVRSEAAQELLSKME